ncbi:DNA repair protein RecO [Pseudobacillus badius]|uniref:DNA repair protein RecO n=1 Tax=Bacillus badius TaxID=1455 RepID=UPI0005979135|nr:DNA repair protein RecO [Bacillus badius]KIL75342.1 DNA recombination and repair protein RecO [Bacillus badius]KZR60465.1 DNA repair protein RecO [Bacillus badius]
MLQKIEGIVIRTSDYGETNKVVTIYTREKGKLAFMARGAKKPNSRLSSVTQPFTHGSFLVQSGSGLGTLQQGEMMTSMRYIREDLLMSAHAAYMAELLDKSTEEKKPNPYLYELFEQCLHYLNEGYDAEVITAIFEMKMLQVIGLHPELSGCAHCGSREGRFAFSIRENGFLCHRCFEVDPYLLPLSQAAIKLLRLFYFFDLKRLGDIKVKEETKKELRTAISLYYDEYSGIYLKSRRFLDQMERMQSFLVNKEQEED